MNKKTSAASYFREKIARIKTHLPPDWRQQIVEAYPEYNSLDGAGALARWYNGRSSNPELTERAEALFLPKPQPQNNQ